ncbi:hypothetical protein AC578_10580 [Pseudocercospora eumusae]|uniref:Uncharacterized protein n=1 Tax=Pseudocercospora eumusae TaxID=321146 RepID=A0A139HKP1_9PEZI|nr:hypothetical protein AC578_10580 [Pseudocercospora eumusae]
MDVGSLHGKIAIITGGSRGIGKAIAIEFAKRGVKGVRITLTYRSNVDAANATCSELNSLGCSTRLLQAPEKVSNDYADGVIKATLEAFDTPGIDILVNNAAGMGLGRMGEVTPELFHHFYDWNVLAPYLLTQSVLRVIRQGGSIVNISSLAARLPSHQPPMSGSLTLYCASKAALEHQTRCLAAAYAGEKGITMNVVAPGAISTEAMLAQSEDMLYRLGKCATAAERLGTPEEVADVVAWLAGGGGARWINGWVRSSSLLLYATSESFVKASFMHWIPLFCLDVDSGKGILAGTKYSPSLPADINELNQPRSLNHLAFPSGLVLSGLWALQKFRAGVSIVLDLGTLAEGYGGHGTEYELGISGTAHGQRDSRVVWITDIHGHENEFDIETSGFALHKHKSDIVVYSANEEEVRKRYYPEMEEFLLQSLQHTGATRVFVMGHITRRHSVEDVDEARSRDPRAAVTMPHPTMFAHIDQSYAGARAVLSGWAPIDPSKHRHAIVNAWRPLKTVHRDPLAVCDARSVAESDLEEVRVALRFESAEGEMVQRVNTTWEVKANPAHKWYWPKQMTPDEVLLFKCFDSKEDGRARWAPHSAFQLPFSDASPRESIEVRALVYWEGQEPV